MNSLIPLLTVSVIGGILELGRAGVHRVTGGDEVFDRSLQRDEVQPRPDRRRVVLKSRLRISGRLWRARPRGALGVSDHAVAVDRLLRSTVGSLGASVVKPAGPDRA